MCRLFAPCFTGIVALGLGGCNIDGGSSDFETISDSDQRGRESIVGNEEEISQTVPADHIYEISQGEDESLCQKYAVHLDALPPRPARRACLPSIPNDPDFEAVVFDDLDPREHMDVVKEIGLTSNSAFTASERTEIAGCHDDKDCLDRLWLEREFLLQRALKNIAAGAYVLRRANLDFNGDGKIETVYQYRSGRIPMKRSCRRWGHGGGNHPDNIMFVRKADDEELHSRFASALLWGQLFEHQDRPHLLKLNSDTVIFEIGKDARSGQSFTSSVCRFEKREDIE